MNAAAPGPGSLRQGGGSMTAVLAPPTKAARFADDAEALGWDVEREKLPEGGRLVRAWRGDEGYELAWHRNSNGTLVFAYGTYSAPSTPNVEVANVKQVLRDMAKVRAANGALLPFDIENDDDVTVLSALAGRTIQWRNSLSGMIEEGVLPRGGLHFKLTQGSRGDNGGARVVNFADQIHTGFRSVYLDSIVEVR